ncbi:MAG TPA: hypothetical protein VGC15_07385 [Acetobacteraceae bacterium]
MNRFGLEGRNGILVEAFVTEVVAHGSRLVHMTPADMLGPIQAGQEHGGSAEGINQAQQPIGVLGQGQYSFWLDQVTRSPNSIKPGSNIACDVLRPELVQHRRPDWARISGQARWEARQCRQDNRRRTSAQGSKRIWAEGVRLVHEQDTAARQGIQGIGPLNQAGRFAALAERTGQFL